MSAERAALNALRQNFFVFAAKAFNIVNPGQDLIPTPAFLAISHKLAELAQGRIRRLVINVPPRSGKSLLASIALPAFILGRDPTRRVICASYSGELAAKLARDCRTVMQHPSYQQLFPATVIAGKNTEAELETARGGFRYATSVGGTLTGRGGNLIVIDDPMKPDDAMSPNGREHVWDWFTDTVGSRLDNKAEDAIMVVMQRLHVDDLSGRLLEHGGWDHLSIPAIAEDEQELTIASGRTLVRPIGDILDPEREPRAVLDELRQQLGSKTFEAQYQQQPVPEEGGLIDWKWFRSYDQQPPLAPNDSMVMSWDTALKDTEVSDYSVGIRALVKPVNRVFILEVIRERLNFPALRKRVLEEITKKPGMITLIENAGSGTSLLQELCNYPGIIGQMPIGEKVLRFSSVTPMIEAEQVHLPMRAPWLDAFKRELLSFPASTNDDQVDALSQLLNWLRFRYSSVPLQGTYGRR
jgi:predicted phage terminase large subunit-like protein